MTPQSAISVDRNRIPATREMNPFVALQQEIDRVFDGFSTAFGRTAKDLAPTMDIAETDKDIEVTVELPGMQEKDVQLNLTDNVLTTAARRRANVKRPRKTTT